MRSVSRRLVGRFRCLFMTYWLGRMALCIGAIRLAHVWGGALMVLSDAELLPLVRTCIGRHNDYAFQRDDGLYVSGASSAHL